MRSMLPETEPKENPAHEGPRWMHAKPGVHPAGQRLRGSFYMEEEDAWACEMKRSAAAFEAEMQQRARLMGSYGDPLLDAIAIHGFWLTPHRTWWGGIRWQLEGFDADGNFVVIR